MSNEINKNIENSLKASHWSVCYFYHWKTREYQAADERINIYKKKKSTLMPMYLMRKYSCCFVVLRKKKVNKTGSGSGWVSASVWALRDCVRIKVGMGRQIFIKRGGGVSGAEPRLPLILRRLALSSPTPPHTALPPPPPSLSPFLPLPPLPSSPSCTPSPLYD